MKMQETEEKEKSEFEERIDNSMPEKKYEKTKDGEEVARTQAAREIMQGFDEEKRLLCDVRRGRLYFCPIQGFVA